jgi:hypothetical protein
MNCRISKPQNYLIALCQEEIWAVWPDLGVIECDRDEMMVI